MISIEVVTTTKLMMTGGSGYLSISTNGGTIVSQQINPLGNDSVFNDIHMLTGFVGVAVGNNGAILWTEDAGVDDQVGFEIINFNDFDNFVDYSKDMLFAGFIATIKSIPSRRPRYPSPFTRTSNHVGNPCLFHGKIFLGDTGTPIRNTAFANKELALAEPDPFTLANLITKSLMFML